MSETRFYVELPADEYGNTALPRAVIEATLVPGRRPNLIITAPAEIASRWPTRYADFYNGYAETEGPARMLTREEYTTLIESVMRQEGDRAGWTAGEYGASILAEHARSFLAAARANGGQ